MMTEVHLPNTNPSCKAGALDLYHVKEFFMHLHTIEALKVNIHSATSFSQW